MSDARQLGEYKPNYKIKCEVCGAVPTIDVYSLKGKLLHHVSLCGPCTWGEAETIDPAKW